MSDNNGADGLTKTNSDSKEKVRDFFRGIAVVIDDKVEQSDENNDPVPHHIFETLKNENMPVVPYTKLPEESAYPSISTASMIILDWQLSDLPVVTIGGATELSEDQNQDKIDFLKEIIKNSTTPVFIISANASSAKAAITKDSDLKKEIDKDRIQVKNKTEFKVTGQSLTNQLFTFLGKWLNKQPALYALKEWEKTADLARSTMYRDFAFSSWADVMWKRIKIDTDNDLTATKEEFGEFITRNIVNRFGKFDFEDSRFSDEKPVDEKLKKVLSAERFSLAPSKNLPKDLRTGNLYSYPYSLDPYQKVKKNTKKKYKLIISADCDLSRSTDDSTVCYIEGTAFTKDFAPSKVQDSDHNLLLSNGTPKNVDALEKEELQKQIKRLMRLWGSPRERYGAILSEAQNCTYLPAIDDQNAIRFDLSVCFCDKKSFIETTDMSFLGRVVPPYIVKIQQTVASWMIRQGTLPVPSEFFSSLY